jgi:hypothetical protein
MSESFDTFVGGVAMCGLAELARWLIWLYAEAKDCCRRYRYRVVARRRYD